MKIVLEKRGNEIVKNMHNNFAKETNQRDEDAEMQKFIEEKLREKREAEKLDQAAAGSTANDRSTAGGHSSGVRKYKTPEEALFDLPKFLIESKPKSGKSEETLSEQMLSGIPEVDLGVEERIKNIEETERAKQKLLVKPASAPVEHPHTSHHKQFATVRTDHGGGKHHNNNNNANNNKRKYDEKGNSNSTNSNGDQKKKGDGPVERSTDDQCLEKFKKNMRHSRSSRIRIA
jgi:hypothetical protein